jgi:hypothetical protein
VVFALGHITSVRHEQERREDLLPLDGQVVSALIGHRYMRVVTGTLILPEEGGRMAWIDAGDRRWPAPLGELHQVTPV